MLVVLIFLTDLVQDGTFVNIIAYGSGFLFGVAATTLISYSQVLR